MEKFGNGVVYVLLVTVNLFLMMFMLSSMWEWFVVPIGIKSIGYAQAFGLSLMITYFQTRNPKLFKPEVMLKRTFYQRFGYNFGMTLMALTIGYITSLFM